MPEDNVAAPQGEAAPLTNAEPQAPASEAPTLPSAEQVAQYFGTTPETLAEYQKFMDNNGGFDKAYTTTKRIISQRTQPPVNMPQPQPQQPSYDQQPPMQPPYAPQPYQQPYQPQPQPQPQNTNGATFQELALQNYFERLSESEAYAPIRDEIRSGEVIKQLKDWNIPIVAGDQVNTEGITRYLDMYAKTKPPVASQAPITPTPLAEPVQVPGDKITNMNDAMMVLKQDQEFRAKGQPGHPLAAQANQFFDGVLNAQQNRGRREHKVVQ